MSTNEADGTVAAVVPPRQILPGSVIGMLGGGQLGRMFALEAAKLGYRVVVLADRQHAPAAAVAHQTLVGDPTDRSLLDQLAQQCDVVTLEFENLPVDAVRYLAQRVGVFPSAEVLRIAQDRGIEKQTLRDAGLPVTPFRLVSGPADALAALEELGPTLVLKTTRDGYDGKGQWKITSAAELHRLAERPVERGGIDFGRPLIAEAWVDYQQEISVIIARNFMGETAVYPLFENRHRNHILDVTLCPASVDREIADQATVMAIRAAEAMSLVGLICIEFFVTRSGEVMINEFAPRAHNSGHLSIEGCHTSQFQQQLRAVCGLPLGATDLVVPAAAMVNLLGDHWPGERLPDWATLLRQPGAHLHLYDKGEPRIGRKMGHITLLGQSPGPAALAERGLQARAALATEQRAAEQRTAGP